MSTNHPPVLPPEIISTSFIKEHSPVSGEILKICCHGMFPPIPFNCMVSWYRLHILWLRYIHLFLENTCFLLSVWLILRLVFLCTKMLRFEDKGLESWVNSPSPLRTAGEARESAVLFKRWGLGFQLFCVTGALKAVTDQCSEPHRLGEWKLVPVVCFCSAGDLEPLTGGIQQSF